MKTTLKKIILPSFALFLLLLAEKNSKAQTIPGTPRRAEVFMSVVPGDTTMPKNQSIFRSNSGSPLFKSNTQLNGTMSLTLGDDTTNIDFVHVSLGTSDGGDDLFSKVFDNSQQGTFQDGTSYIRHGYSIIIGLGQYIGLNSYYASVFFESQSGSTSSVYKYRKQ